MNILGTVYCNSFTPKYVESVCEKTGNKKRFKTFARMVKQGVEDRIRGIGTCVRVYLTCYDGVSVT